MIQCKGSMKRIPQVALEWDEGLQKVVAKRTQVGLSESSVPDCERASFQHQGRSGIADVIDAPQELFMLENLADVVSFETWTTILSDSERAHLTGFLPKNNDTDHVVASLLGGENINFGNPFTSWGVSVCSGTSHPEKIIERDAMHHKDKKAYYHQLRSYHGNMVANLEELKEIWRTSKSPERELPTKFQRWMKSKSFKSNSMIFEDKPPHSRDDIRMGKICQKGSFSPNGVVVPYTTRDIGVGKDGELFLRQTPKKRRSGLSSEVSERENISKENAEDWSNALLGDATASEDVPLDFMRAVKVRRKTLTEIMEKNKFGEDLHIDSMKSVLASVTVSGFKTEQGIFSESGANNRLTDHWGNIVHKDLPHSHKTWRKWKLQSTNFAKSISEQCILQLPQVLQLPFEQKINNTTYSVPSAVDTRDFQPSNFSLESIVLSSDGKTSSTGQSRSFETNISKGITLAGKRDQLSAIEDIEISTQHNALVPLTCLRGESLLETDSQLESEDKTQKLVEYSVQNLKLVADDASPVLAIVTSHGEVEPIQARAETKTLSSFSEELVTPSNSDPEKCSSEDMVVFEDEASAIHDDEVSALHQIWSTESLDTRVLSLEQGTAMSAKESDTFISVKCSNYRETPINPAKGLDTLGLIRGVAREADQCDSLHPEQACTTVDSRVFEPQNMLPPIPCKELSVIRSSSNPSVTLADEHKTSGRCIYNEESDLVATGNKSSESYSYQTENHVLTQFFPPAVTIAKSDTSWKFSGPSLKYAASGNQLLQIDHHFDGFHHTQRPFTPQMDPEEASLRLELDINYSNFPLLDNPVEVKGREPFSNCYENGHGRKEQFDHGDFLKPELQLLTSHGSLEPKILPHWAYSSKTNGMNQHSSCQLGTSIPTYDDQITQDMVDLKQEQMLEQVSQPCSALHLNLGTPSTWSAQADKLHRSEKGVPFPQTGTYSSSWGNGNNVLHSQWMSAENKSSTRPPLQRVDKAPHLLDDLTQASCLVGYGERRHEKGMGTQGAFTCSPRPLSSQGEWAISQSLPPDGSISYHQNGSSPSCLPGHSWMNLQATSHTSMLTHHIPSDPSTHVGSQLDCPQSSWIPASGLKNGQLHPWMKNPTQYPP